jgi:hypothetical protein
MYYYFFFLDLDSTLSKISMRFVLASTVELKATPLKELLDLLKVLCEKTDKTYLFDNFRAKDISFQIEEGDITYFSLNPINEWSTREEKFLGKIFGEDIRVYYP